MAKTKNTSIKPKAASKTKSSAKAKATAKQAASGERKTPDQVEALILRTIAEDYALSGQQEFSKAILATAAGYGNPRSAGFIKVLAVFFQKCILEKGAKDHVRLTKKGIASVPKVDPPKNNEEYFEQRLFPVLKKKVQNPAKVPELWKILADGKAHETKSLAKTLGYGNPRSMGYTSMISALKGMKMAENAKGLIKLTDAAFPCGRP